MSGITHLSIEINGTTVEFDSDYGPQHRRGFSLLRKGSYDLVLESLDKVWEGLTPREKKNFASSRSLFEMCC